MKSRLLPDIKITLPIRRLTVAALCAALMLTAQVALAGLANVELVSLLVMLFALKFRRTVLYSIYVFALVEGVIYGFHIWWITYLYIWTILAGLTWLFRKTETALGWATLSGAFGLVFGALCAIPYLFVGGISAAVAYWAAGIPFDLAHCAGNFILCLLLWKPLHRALERFNMAL